MRTKNRNGKGEIEGADAWTEFFFLWATWVVTSDTLYNKHCHKSVDFLPSFPSTQHRSSQASTPDPRVKPNTRLYASSRGPSRHSQHARLTVLRASNPSPTIHILDSPNITRSTPPCDCSCMAGQLRVPEHHQSSSIRIRVADPVKRSENQVRFSLIKVSSCFFGSRCII